MGRQVAVLGAVLALAGCAAAPPPRTTATPPSATIQVADASTPETYLVVGVADGDTLTVITAGRQQIKVRLAEIDAPEKKQPFGAASKDSLADLCFEKPAQLVVQDIDRYGRTVARVTCDGTDANREQIRRGMAWVYRKYSRDPALLDVEAEAREARRGLWSEPNPVPPWEWRRQ